MKILEFKLQHKLSNTEKLVINKESQVHIFHSDVNSTGKTTLMRAILYTLGFNIPDTELVKFSNYEFNMKLVVKDKIFNICRKSALITINGTEFDLPVDEFAVRTLLFDITNYDLLNNLLGTIYFDQEKGWTMLNRGTIIGKNRFTIENFFRGLNDDVSDESYGLESELKAIEKKISQYNLMSDVAEYQAEVNQNVNGSLCYNSFYEESEKEQIEASQRLDIVEKELSIINDIIKNNKTFVDFIEQKKIFVNLPDGTPMRVTRHNLFNYEQVCDANEARKSLLVAERNMLRQRIAEIQASREKQLTFDTLPTVEEQLVQKLSEIKNIGSVEVKTILDGLKKERERISKKLLERTKLCNHWIDEVCTIAKTYATELKIPDKYKIDIFTHKLKSKSGAILHKMVFIYKLAYIKVLSKKINYPLPIFCDSPNGREVERTTIHEMLSIIKRDFSEHQLFIATICDYKDIFENANIITMNGKLFDRDNLFDYIKN
jgi:hypothetical protein